MKTEELLKLGIELWKGSDPQLDTGTGNQGQNEVSFDAVFLGFS
jgi:hypothetical protein